MSELKYQIALSQTPHVGPVLAKQLIAYTGGCEAVFNESYKALLKIPKIGPSVASSVRSFDVNQVDQIVQAVQDQELETLFYLSEKFPYRLKQIPDSPLLLYIKGNHVLGNQKMLAVVGTRKMTHYGRQFIDSLNNSKLLAGLTMLLLNIGSKYIEIGFSKTQEQALRNGLARELLIFAVVFMATHDIIMSILLTAAFVVLSDFLLNEKSQFCIVPEKLRAISIEVDTDKDGHISDEEERRDISNNPP